MDFTGIDAEIDSFNDFFAFNSNVEACDVQN